MGSDGIISSILEHLDPRFRPLAEAIIVLFVAGAAAATVLNPILDLVHRIWRFFRWLGRAIKTIFKKPEKLDPPPPGRTIPDETTIWERHAPAKLTLPNDRGVPIITVAAMKGGVGKTTIAANLAVYFRRTKDRPVLLIDFDYQGSLSDTIRGEAGYTDRDITSDVLIRPETEFPSPELFVREMRRDLEDVFIYPANYPLATIENNLMIDWVQNPEDDLIYRLCRHLRKPAFQEKYCAIIIDSPPRLTSGSINALCASTHLLL